MGLGELFQQTATTVLLFKADVSDAKRGLKELSGEEKKAAEQAIKLAEARNKSMERLAKGITAANVVMKLGAESIKIAGDAWKSYETAALKAGGADAEKARAFRSALSSFDSSMDKVKQSIGSIVASLAPLVELAARIVGYAADAIGVVGDIVGGIGSAGFSPVGGPQSGSWFDKGVQKSSAYIADPARAMKLAQVVNALAASGLISASAIQTQRYAEGVAGNVKLDPAQSTLLDALGLASPLVGGAFRGTGQSAFKGVLGGLKAPKKRGGGGSAPEVVAFVTDERTGATYPLIDWGAMTSSQISGLADVARAPIGFSTDFGAAPSSLLNVGTGGLARVDSHLVGQDAARNLFKGVDIRGAGRGLQEYAAGQSKSVMEQYIGPVQEIDAYRVAFEGVAGAATAAFDAWRTGAMSAGAAVKMAVASTLGALGQEMLIRALQETAMGVASLAIGGPVAGVSAGAHFKAAALFGAGAAAAGIASKALGSGGSAGGGGGYGGPPSGFSGGGDHRSGGGETRIYYVGEGWERGPSEQRQHFARSFRASQREMESAEGVRDA
jgi:hypothetical protein